jgi:hypothetical protein
MRDRGVLAPKQRGKIVRLTTGRVAGLLAACVVLAIGAYSIGLHRGEDDVITSVRQEPEITRMNELGGTAPAPQAEAETATDASDRDALKKKEDAPATPPAPARSREARPVEESVAAEKKSSDADKPQESLAETFSEGLAAAGRADDNSAPASKSLEREDRTAALTPPPAAQGFAPESAMQSVAPSKDEHSFTLGGSSLRIDAPESIVITEERESNTLTINSSGTLVHIRPASAGAELQSRAKPLYRPLGTVTRSYQLGTSRFDVDAPAGFRIVEDRQGGMLLIYTSDGIVRIRLAN